MKINSQFLNEIKEVILKNVHNLINLIYIYRQKVWLHTSWRDQQISVNRKLVKNYQKYKNLANKLKNLSKSKILINTHEW